MSPNQPAWPGGARRSRCLSKNGCTGAFKAPVVRAIHLVSGCRHRILRPPPSRFGPGEGSWTRFCGYSDDERRRSGESARKGPKGTFLSLAERIQPCRCTPSFATSAVSRGDTCSHRLAPESRFRGRCVNLKAGQLLVEVLAVVVAEHRCQHIVVQTLVCDVAGAQLASHAVRHWMAR